MTKTHKTIAVDFDGTLADDSRVKYPDLGPPIPTMVERVRRWIQDGHTVKIVTSRLATADRDAEKLQVKFLTEWCDLIGLTQKDGKPLVLASAISWDTDEYWSCRAVGVIRNTGATYFEAEHYRENWRTPQDVDRNGAQLELQFGGAEYEQFTDNRMGGIYGLGTGVQAQTAAIEQGRKQNPRYVPVGLIGGSKGYEDYLNRKYRVQLAAQAQQASELSNQLRADPEFKSLQTYLATDPREPYTR